MVSKSYFLVLLLVICSFSFLPVEAIVESLGVFKLENQVMVASIGDGHIFNKVDDEHAEFFLGSPSNEGFLDRVADAQEDTLLLIECSEKNYQANERVFEFNQLAGTPSKVGFYFQVARYAKKHCFCNKRLHMEFAELRGRGVCSLTSIGVIAQALLPQFEQAVGIDRRVFEDLENFERYLVSNPQAKEMFFRSALGFRQLKTITHFQDGNITGHVCLEEVKQALDTLSAFRDSYKKNDPEFEVMDNFIKEIVPGYDRLKDLLGYQLKSLEDPCIEAFLNLIEKNQSFGPLIALGNQWYHDFGNCITDAGFHMAFLKARKKYKRIMFFGGNSHAATFNRNLQKHFKAQPVVLKGLLEETRDYVFKGARVSKEEMRDHLAFLVPPYCATCAKKADQVPKFYVCGRCKQIRYCSGECQTKDWSRHKPQCVPIKVESANKIL